MNDRHQRLGLIADLEQQRDAIERRLKGIAGSIADALFYVHSPMDTDGASVAQFGAEYFECQEQGRKIKARLDELEDA